MNFWLIFLMVIGLLHAAPAYPKGKIHLALEQNLKNKLHKPWHTTDHPPQYPRKGEFKCKSGNCKLTNPMSDDTQAPVPLDVHWDYIKH